MVAPKGWKGTVKAMKQHHPDKFGDGEGKLNPYAIAYSMKKKGAEAHYKDEKSSTTKSEPKKKEKYEDKKLKEMSFYEWLVHTGKVGVSF
tara:strand:+ start:170 stop:439 length:270 start_codon:yes stop_codon:yes gene_type:complete